LPRASDYISSIMLVAIPAVAVSMAIMSMRNTTYSIQTSVYVVYLDAIGLFGTTIGILFAIVEIASGFGALLAGRAMRLGNPQRTMLSGTVLSIVLIAITPLLGGIFVLLLLAQGVRGWLEGLIQPVILSVQARAVGRHQQGAVVGLRQTGQRLTPDAPGGGRHGHIGDAERGEGIETVGVEVTVPPSPTPLAPSDFRKALNGISANRILPYVKPLTLPNHAFVIEA
jgi:hypothetical protein